jgi:hypothetical protein
LIEIELKKYIIGIGCSWTQGAAGYPDEITKLYNGRVQQTLRGNDYAVRKYEHENSWVNVLCRDYFPEYTPVNLGTSGTGNRAASLNLHFCDKVDFNNSTGIIIFMLSGFERFDFFNKHPKAFPNETINDDFYSSGEYSHYKWRAVWPVSGSDPVWNVYAKELWSEEFVATENMMSLLNVQTFAKAHGYKLIVCNAFNPHDKHQHTDEYLKEYAGKLADKFDWDNSFIHRTTAYKSFLEKLIELDGLTDLNSFYNYYKNLDWPSKYLSNCNGTHPTIEGYKVIAKEIAEFIKTKI